MKYFSYKFFLAALMTLAAFAANAQEFKVGVVIIDRIFREANSAKAAQAKLEQEFGKRDKEITELGTQLKAAADRFEREAPTLSESQRNARQKQLVEQDRDFQRKRREHLEDLNSRKNEELQQLIERANKVVKTVAESEKYDLILEGAVYVSPKHDITDKVIKALNASR
jgi:outer membrane protein